jgi:hypothetical protein
MSDLDKFKEWVADMNEKFTVTLKNKKGEPMEFIFKKEPTMGTFEKLMNVDKQKQGTSMSILLHDILMSPVVGIKTLRNKLGGNLFLQLISEVMENIEIPEMLSEGFDGIRQRVKGDDNGSSDEGT